MGNLYLVVLLQVPNPVTHADGISVKVLYKFYRYFLCAYGPTFDYYACRTVANTSSADYNA